MVFIARKSKAWNLLWHNGLQKMLVKNVVVFIAKKLQRNFGKKGANAGKFG